MAEYESRSEWSYPETSMTLFGKLREAQTGVDDAAWARFVDMYGPVVHHLVRLVSPWLQAADVDHAVQLPRPGWHRPHAPEPGGPPPERPALPGHLDLCV